jgi:hypothetical protein
MTTICVEISPIMVVFCNLLYKKSWQDSVGNQNLSTTKQGPKYHGPIKKIGWEYLDTSQT